MHHPFGCVNNFFRSGKVFFRRASKGPKTCCSVAGSGRYPSAPHLSTLFCKKVVRHPGISPQIPARKRLAGNYT